MTAGPVKNLTAIENVATDFPQAMIFGCKAMNKPANRVDLIRQIIMELALVEENENDMEEQDEIPRLNIAIPKPASDRIEMDPLMMVGISMCHL